MPPAKTPGQYRKPTRWEGYDYQSDGTYFVTICTHQRMHLFGTVDGDFMVLNLLGLIAEEEWWRSGKLRQEVILGAFIIMPDHLHGLVEIAHPDEPNSEKAPTEVRARRRTPCAPTSRPPRSLGSLIAGFKSATTRRINETRNSPGAQVWQRNYYDHVVRNDDDLARIQYYMSTNPQRWTLDRTNQGKV